MNQLLRRRFLAGGVLGAGALLGASLFNFASAQGAGQTGKKWVCPPCGCGQDGKEFDAVGLCPACGMLLVQKADARTAPDDGHVHPEPPADAGNVKSGTAPPAATPSRPPDVSASASQ